MKTPMDKTTLAVLRGAHNLKTDTIGDEMLPHYKALIETGLVEITFDFEIDDDGGEVVKRLPAGDYVLALHEHFDPTCVTGEQVAEAAQERDALNNEALAAYEAWCAEQSMDPKQQDNLVPWAYTSGYIARAQKS